MTWMVLLRLQTAVLSNDTEVVRGLLSDNEGILHIMDTELREVIYKNVNSKEVARALWPAAMHAISKKAAAGLIIQGYLDENDYPFKTPSVEYYR